ncbi:hypothetical protein EKH55_1295 [Sinorhizobium alkalisoli]|nr:hypothetical protein EKH55_1295 [Sinorhizobium alkalisoli]
MLELQFAAPCFSPDWTRGAPAATKNRGKDHRRERKADPIP